VSTEADETFLRAVTSNLRFTCLRATRGGFDADRGRVEDVIAEVKGDGAETRTGDPDGTVHREDSSRRSI